MATRTKKKQAPASLRASVGGASNEVGSYFRAAVAAWAAAHGLAGRSLPLFRPGPSSGIPATVHLETSDELDDLRVIFVDGTQAHIQAKHSVTLAPTSEPMQASIRQWRAGLTNPALDVTKTRLVLVTAHASNSVRALASALQRRKESHRGADTSAETEALSRFKKMVNVTDNQFATLCKMAAIVELPFTPSMVAIEDVSIALLDGAVVVAGQGSQAWAALVDYARQLARRRAGDSIPGWLDAIRRSNLNLVTDAQASVAGRLEAERQVVQRHRERLISAASVLDLRGLGVPVAPLRVQIEIDDIRVQPLDQQSERASGDRPILSALRRRGRSLLAGAPGAGKSTALKQAAAEWGRHTDWPIPVLVRLTEFLRASRTRSPLDALLIAAMEDVPADDQALLRSALDREIRIGNVALFLDALDETRERRFAVVKHLDRLFKHELASVSEIVLSTRDSAYADGATLGFRPLRVSGPRNLTGLVSGLLTSMADHAGLDSSARPGWIRERETWVDGFISRDPSLGETPLMPLLLVILATESTSGVPPSGRVQILNKVVDNVVYRWEVRQRRTGEVRVGPLEGMAATAALFQCFARVGWHLIVDDAVDKATAEAAVAAAFRSYWELAPGHATVAAREALHFWDEAGIYVFGGSEETLSARVTLLAEIGAARHLVSLQRSDQKAGVSHLAIRNSARTTLSLAMSADEAISGDLIRAAVERADVDLLLWCADQVSLGVRVKVEDLSHLATVLLERGPVSNAEAWRVAKSLCRLAVPPPAADLLSPYLQKLTPSQRVIAHAMRAVQAGREPENVDLVLTAIVKEVRPEGRLNRPPGGPLVITLPDDDVEALAVTLADRYLIARPDTAELFAEIAKQAGSPTYERLWALLDRAGRRDLWSKDHRDFVESMKRFAEDGEVLHEMWNGFLAQIRAFSEPSSLSLMQRRRLDELADFIGTLRYGESTPREIWNAFQGEPNLPWLFRTTAILGGFDLHVLAAEAEIALGMENASADSMSFLFDASSRRELLHWNDVPDPLQAMQTLTDLVGSKQWASRAAVRALEYVPLKRETAVLLNQKLDAYGPYQRLHAAWLIIALQPTDAQTRLSQWRDHGDAIRRRVAAITLAGTRSPDELAWAFHDLDGSVRAEVVERVGKRPDVALFTDLLQSVASSEPTGWLCLWCGTQNAAAAHAGCAVCRASSPDCRRNAQELVEKLGVAFTPPKTPVPRILSRADFE